MPKIFKYAGYKYAGWGNDQDRIDYQDFKVGDLVYFDMKHYFYVFLGWKKLTRAERGYTIGKTAWILEDQNRVGQADFYDSDVFVEW